MQVPPSQYRRTATQPTGSQAPSTYYYVIEMLTPIRATIVYMLFVGALVFGIVVASYASHFFECASFCDLDGTRACPLLGTAPPAATCINITATDWWAVGLPSWYDSNFRRFAQWMIQAEGSNYSYNTSVRLTIRYYNSTMALLSEVVSPHLQKHSTSSSNVWYSMSMFPDYGAMREGTQYVNFHFDGVPWKASPNASGPINASALTNPSVLYTAMNEGWAITAANYRMGWCGVCVLFLLLHLRAVVHYMSEVKRDAMAIVASQPSFSGRVLAGARLMPLDHLLMCFFQVAVALSTDVLAMLSSACRGKFLDYWSEHLMYWLQISLQITLFFAAAFGLSCAHTGRNSYFLRVGVTSATFSIVFFFLDIASLGSSSFDVLLARPQSIAYSPNRTIPALAWALFIIAGLFMLWQYVFRRDSIVFSRGEALYGGEMKVRVLVARMFMGLSMIYVLFWIAFSQILTWQSFFIPLYRVGGIIELTALTAQSCLFMLVCSPCKKSLEDFPPHPYHPLGYLVDESVVHREEHGKPRRLQEGEALGRIAAPQSWKEYVWTPAQFRTLRSVGISGFYFDTEDEKEAFDDAVERSCAGTADARSFFCLETAFACLNLSNEIYYQYGSADGIIIEAEPTRCELFLGRCCFTNCACCAPEAEPEDEHYGPPTTTDVVPLQGVPQPQTASAPPQEAAGSQHRAQAPSPMRRTSTCRATDTCCTSASPSSACSARCASARRRCSTRART